MRNLHAPGLVLLGVFALASCSDPEPAADAAMSTDVEVTNDLSTDTGGDVPSSPTDAGDDATATDIGDAGLTDASPMDATSDLGDATGDAEDAGADGGTALPTMWRDETLPEFRITIAPADLATMLTMGNETRVPMTLRYMGGTYTGTIRQRLGNNSSCAMLRQFRLDFPSAITFPDGYRSDRFETDRGRCYALHEWLSVGVMRRVALARPDLRIHYKYTNVVAIYFNDALYNVETLTEDVNRDLGQRLEGTRDVTFHENGCYLAPTTGFIGTFCRTFDRATLSTMLDIPAYLQWSAAVKALAPGDNYPDYPYNWVLVQNNMTNIARPLGDDWDEVPALEPDAGADPFVPSNPAEYRSHLTALLEDPELRAQYRRDLQVARAAMDPAITLPLLAMKYAQVRALLLAVPGSPFGAEQYDNLYAADGEVPHFLQERYDFLGRLLGDAGL